MESCQTIIFTCGSALPTTPSVSITHTHTHTHTHTQLFLSHAPCSFICSVHTAVSQKCKHGADDGGAVWARVDPGLGCTFYSRSHPPRGRRGAFWHARDPSGPQAEESGRSSLWEKNPLAVCDPKPPLTSAWFSPRLVLLPLIWALALLRNQHVREERDSEGIWQAALLHMGVCVCVERVD